MSTEAIYYSLACAGVGPDLQCESCDQPHPSYLCDGVVPDDEGNWLADCACPCHEEIPEVWQQSADHVALYHLGMLNEKNRGQFNKGYCTVVRVVRQTAHTTSDNSSGIRLT